MLYNGMERRQTDVYVLVANCRELEERIKNKKVKLKSVEMEETKSFRRNKESKNE